MCGGGMKIGPEEMKGEVFVSQPGVQIRDVAGIQWGKTKTVQKMGILNASSSKYKRNNFDVNLDGC